MCCGSPMHHGSFLPWGRASHPWRCCSTKKDKVEALEEYLDGLREETEAVEQRIAELKKAK